MDIKMETPPPIPNRNSLRQKKHRRRRSLPGPNHVKIEPASQEVLSSLIDNLQNLSARDRIDARHSQSGAKGYGQVKSLPKGPVFGAYNHETDETHEASHLHPLDAAIPPVVRPSKRTVPLPSPSLFPNLGDFANANLRPNSSGSQWTRREENDRLARDEYSTPEPRYRSSDRSPSKLSKSQRGKRASVISRTSNEHVKERASGHLPSPSNSFTLRTSEAIRQGGKRSSDAGDRSSLSFLDDSSPDPKTTIVNVPSRRSSKRISGEKTLSAISKQPSMGSVGDGKKIPSRNSSLRHSMGATSSPRIKRTSRYSEKDTSKEDEDVIPESIPQSKIKEETATESDTVKRIEELNARRASWNQNSQIHKPPFNMRAFMKESSTPVVPIKEALTRTVSTPTVTIISTELHPMDGQPSPVRKRSQLLRNGSPLLRAQSDTVVPTSLSTSPAAVKPDQSNNKKSRRKSKRASRNATPLSPNGVDLSHFGIDESDKVNDRPPTADSIDVEVDEFLAAPRLSQKISDPYTGRVVAFSEVGDPEGSAVICCVGMGLTRYLTAFYDDLARTLKLRLITPDRPGVGESDAYIDGSDTPLGWSGERKPPFYSHRSSTPNSRTQMTSSLSAST